MRQGAPGGGNCLANQLLLTIHRRIHVLLEKVDAKMLPNLVDVKKRLKKLLKIHQKKINKIKLFQTCTKKKIKNLNKKLEALDNKKTREKIIRWIVYSTEKGPVKPLKHRWAH